MSDTHATEAVRGRAVFIRCFEVRVVEGKDAGASAVSQSPELAIGTAEGNDLCLTDPAVSKHHCVLRTHARGLELRDLGSRNGTFAGDTELARGFVRSGARIRVGQTTIVVRVLDQEIEQTIADDERLGALLGASAAMRRLYPVIERCARSSATVMVQGETGTGKELVAEAIHDLGDRRSGPFVIVDCGALAHDLAESELFGHERGAFTGADSARVGAFESADGGTVFLDEIGELPLALQPLLLRVLESRTIRRVGSNAQRAVDVRVIAATHRELRELVNEKRFRADLFYRLHVIRIDVPPLRDRPGDVRLLADHFWHQIRTDTRPPPALLDHLALQSWPGNVRELRNAVERAALVGQLPEATATEATDYRDAKERWERGWVAGLLAAHDGKLLPASRAARVGRSHLRDLARKYGLVTARTADDDD